MMDTDLSNENFRELALLRKIEDNPDVSQASLAEDLGVAIGTVNWHLKRLVEKGFVKVKRIRRRKLRYIITPEGIALRARLTMEYIRQSFSLFREVRYEVSEILRGLKNIGITDIRLVGDGDIAEVCRLTCMENHINITEKPGAPVIVVDGLTVRFDPDGKY